MLMSQLTGKQRKPINYYILDMDIDIYVMDIDIYVITF